ncbi:hypothetical protein BC828DRAFT_395129 [Blastocladiella britannica]|nr:hypothetical protein BC828DRAFT_395129 [Blastocladiella britannica]
MDSLIATLVIGRGPPRDPTPEELRTFASVMDTFIAAAPASEGLHPDLAALTSSQVAPIAEIWDLLRTSLPTPAKRKLLLVLYLLTRPAGTFALSAGSATLGCAFADLDRDTREKIVLGWRGSATKLNRTLFALFRGVSMLITYGLLISSPHLPIVKDGLRFPGLWRPPVESRPDPPAGLHVETLVDLKPDDSGVVTIDTDVVIVGSGAGGGCAAGVLTAAGYKVVVLEKGAYYPPQSLPPTELASVRALYDRGGLLTSDDASINILAGSTVGGGTAVNWSASLRPQHWLREEWAARGLPYFASPEFIRAIDAVCARIGVSATGVAHNNVNAVMVKGCDALGMPVATIPQNTGGKPHACGSCGFGCASSIKMSSAATWLADAGKRGGRVISGVAVRRVLVEGGRAVGVEGIATEPDSNMPPVTVRVRAKHAVIAAAGSIHTPALLRRSGLKNWHIGRHLGLHPVAVVFGVFDDDKVPAMDPWNGSMMTAISSVVERQPGQAPGTFPYGAKLECTTLTPMFASALIPWHSPAAHKAMLADLNRTANIIVLSRDRDRKASVEVDEDGEPDVRFDLSAYDQVSLVEGAVRAAQILVAAGARRVYTTQPDVPVWDRPSSSVHRQGTGADDPTLVAWTDQVRSAGFRPLATPLFAAHQMGTARMGSSPSASVVDPRGQCWECPGLYVADASAFPTSSGVNPMVTTYALAYSVARFLAGDQLGPDAVAKVDTAYAVRGSKL